MCMFSVHEGAVVAMVTSIGWLCIWYCIRICVLPKIINIVYLLIAHWLLLIHISDQQNWGGKPPRPLPPCLHTSRGASMSYLEKYELLCLYSSLNIAKTHWRGLNSKNKQQITFSRFSSGETLSVFVDMYVCTQNWHNWIHHLLCICPYGNIYGVHLFKCSF